VEGPERLAQFGTTGLVVGELSGGGGKVGNEQLTPHCIPPQLSQLPVDDPLEAQSTGGLNSGQ
jgi:hypothetical protein